MKKNAEKIFFILFIGVIVKLNADSKIKFKKFNYELSVKF